LIAIAEKNYLYHGSECGGVYCPKCEKTIKKERLAEVNRQLKARFKKDSLEQGQCPVCGTQLLDTEKYRKG